MFTLKNEADFLQYLKHPVVLVDFYATWCGPCKALGPLLTSMSNKKMYSRVCFLKVDVDDFDAIAARYRVSAMPTICIFEHGKEVARIVGVDLAKIETALQKYVTH